MNPLDPSSEPDPTPAQLSLNSLAGHLVPKTLRVVGMIFDQAVLLLVDVGSTHNFIQQHLVTQLRLSFCTTTPLSVMVGNGQQLECCWLCEAVTIDLQPASFTVDLYVLPIAGANVILGIQWFQSLGPVLIDYNTLTKQFFHQGSLIKLRGDKDATMGMMTPHQL